MNNGSFILVTAFVCGCATAFVPSPAAVTSPPATRVAPPSDGSPELSFGLPDSGDWQEADRRAHGYAGWTPDLVLRNDKLGAIIAFLGVPRVLGSPLVLADALSRKHEGRSAVSVDATGRTASFTYCGRDMLVLTICGKVVVVDVEGDRLENVVLSGRWPAGSDVAATRDIDEVARTIRVTSIK